MAKKWYKIKTEVLKSNDPLVVLIALLFEALSVKVEDDKLRKLSPSVRFLFEETTAPKLTKESKGVIN